MTEQELFLKIILEIFNTAKNKEFRSFDISDLKKNPMDNFLYKHKMFGLDRYIRYLYTIFSSKFPNFARSLIKDKYYKYPQAQAMLIMSIVSLHKKKIHSIDLKNAIKEAEWLIENKSKYFKHHGWGQPFDWFCNYKKLFPKNTPRATVSSQVGMAFLDLYEVTNNKKYLDEAVDICYLFIKEFNHKEDSNGNLCLSYTPLDNTEIHNANILAAALIMRVFSYTKIEFFFKFSKKCADFTKNYQEINGSFKYSTNKNSKIDNYHTGFVLEGYYLLAKYSGIKEYYEVFKKGLDYYALNLFEGSVPCFTNEKKYPVDIQSCAQSILTFNLDKSNIESKSKSLEIASYTIKNLYLSQKRHFAYQKYEREQDESYYFRWGDAWMLRALAAVL